MDERHALTQAYRRLTAAYERYAGNNPHVENTFKLHRRVRRDLVALEKFCQSLEDEGDDDDPVWIEQRRNQLQGFRNNFANHDAKLKVAERLEDVVAVGKVFQFPLAPGIESKGQTGDGVTLKPVKVEVDIVANGGSTWLQIRTVRIADVNSLHWTGMPGHHKGLEQKLKDLMTVSRSSEHWIRWKPPEIVVYCMEAFAADVVKEIGFLGAHVISGDLENLSQIPPRPPPPTVTNLDVTTLCALVSEVTHRGGADIVIVQWAKRNPHWQLCIEHEVKDRLMPHLQPYLTDRPLIAAERAVRQFESLLDLLSGPIETQRWQELLPKLTIYKTADEEAWMSKRVRSLHDMTELQASVFGLGDSARALTLSSNQKLVQKLKLLGIELECVVHRPVWLTGL